MTNNLIAQRILELAAGKGLRRADIPKMTGVSKNRLDNLFKRPGAQPNRDDLRMLAAFLETTEQYLLFGGDKPSSEDALRAEVRDRLHQLTEGELRLLAVGLRRQPSDASQSDE